MKKIKTVLLFALLITLSACSAKPENVLVQMTDHSPSQMMGYIIQSNGKTIVVDGGTREDKDALLEELKKIDDDNVVDAWLLTHYHKDHTGALSAYLDSGADDLDIESIYYDFPNENFVATYEPNRLEDLTNITSSLEQHVSQDTLHKNEAGEKIELGDIVIDIVRVFNPLITENAGNNSSTVYKIETNGNKILFLGDLGLEGGEQLLSESEKEIENMDYVQMAHHGQNGVGEEVYEVIHPKYCLWPTPEWLWENTNNEYRTDETKEWISKLHVKKNYIAKDGVQEISLSSK